jgi:hypothetical protein
MLPSIDSGSHVLHVEVRDEVDKADKPLALAVTGEVYSRIFFQSNWYQHVAASSSVTHQVT